MTDTDRRMTEWLVSHVSTGETVGFFTTFAGERVPKDPVIVRQQIAEDLVFALTVCVRQNSGSLPRLELERVCRALSIGESTAKEIWRTRRFEILARRWPEMVET